MGIESLRTDMAELEQKAKTGDDIELYQKIVTNFISVNTDVLTEIEIFRDSLKDNQL